MPAFSEVENQRPPGNVVVPPSAFATTWGDRPDEDVCIGLRFVADADLEDARVEAYRRACELFPDHKKDEETTTLWIASFQDALVRWIIGRGTCDPNDAMKPWPPWAAAPEDLARDALSDKGAQFIFDAWERMRIAADIGMDEASDEQIDGLPVLVAARFGALSLISRPRALRVRRLLRFVVEELNSVEPLEETTADVPPTQ